jgi:hypothetical protein
MSEHVYQKLSGDARELLERNIEERRTFLRFLGVLQDVLARKLDLPEPPVFTKAEQVEKASGLSETLTHKAHLRDTAVANRERAFAVTEGEAWAFLSDLLAEYNEIRALRQETGQVKVPY